MAETTSSCYNSTILSTETGNGAYEENNTGIYSKTSKLEIPNY